MWALERCSACTTIGGRVWGDRLLGQGMAKAKAGGLDGWPAAGRSAKWVGVERCLACTTPRVDGGRRKVVLVCAPFGWLAERPSRWLFQ
jgi:hypothetical protein